MNVGNVFSPPPKKKRKFMPLHQAILEGDKDFIEKLFYYKCAPKVNAKNRLGLTPLHIAVIRKEEEIVRILISNGADVNAKTNESKVLTIVEGVIKDVPLATYCDKTRAVRLTPLHLSALNGSIEIAYDLIRNGANVNEENIYEMRPLHCAIQSDCKEMILLLLAHNATFKTLQSWSTKPCPSRGILQVAAAHGKTEILKLVLEHKTKIAEDSYCAIDAARNGFQEVIEILFDKGVNIFNRDSTGIGAIHCAIEEGHFGIVKFLLEKGCNPNLYNHDTDEMPLHMAIASKAKFKSKDLNTVELLIRYGADMDYNAGQWGSSLHEAMRTRDSLVMKMLIDSGANSDVRNIYQNTPLEDGLQSKMVSSI